MTEWKRHFESARWEYASSGEVIEDWAVAKAFCDDPLTTSQVEYYDGQTSAEDQLSHLLRAILVNDEVVAAATTDKGLPRVEYMEFLPLWDGRPMPRITIYPRSMSEQNAIVKAADQDISIAVAIRWNPTVAAVDYGDATISSLIDRVRLVVTQNHQMQVAVGGAQVVLTMNRNFVLSGESGRIDLNPEGGSQVLATRELTLVYNVTVDKDTRRIQNMLAARP